MSRFSQKVTYQGAEIEVVGEYYPAHKGMREHGTGLQLEPDEPEYIEIEAAEFKGVDVLEILDYEKLKALVWGARKNDEYT